MIRGYHDGAYLPGHGRPWFLAAREVPRQFAPAVIASAASTVACMPNSFDKVVSVRQVLLA